MVCFVLVIGFDSVIFGLSWCVLFALCVLASFCVFLPYFFYTDSMFLVIDCGTIRSAI